MTSTGKVTSICGVWAERTRRLAGVLDELGVGTSRLAGAFGWNTARYLELYFGVPCTNQLLHALNLRLFPEQLEYVAKHAEDEVVFVDRSLAERLWKLLDRLRTVRHVVVIDDGVGDVPDTAVSQDVHDYETSALVIVVCCS